MERFQRKIYPLLTPRAITMSPGFPVPLLPHLTLCLAVSLAEEVGPTHFAYLRVPDRVPRFLPLDAGEYVPVEDVIRANVAAFYPERRVAGVHLFRLTRAAEIDLDEKSGTFSARRSEKQSVAAGRIPWSASRSSEPCHRRYGIGSAGSCVCERGAEGSGVSDGDVYEVDGMLDLRSLRELTAAPVPKGRFPPIVSRDPSPGTPRSGSGSKPAMCSCITPTTDFRASVVRFFAEAADDPLVSSIRVTLYRVGEAPDRRCAVARACAGRRSCC